MYWLHSLAKEGGSDKDGDRIYWGSTEDLLRIYSLIDEQKQNFTESHKIFEDVNIYIYIVFFISY